MKKFISISILVTLAVLVAFPSIAETVDPYRYDKNRDKTSPCEAAETVIPSDTTVLTTLPRAIWVGVAGDMTVQLLNENGTYGSVAFVDVPVGWFAIRPRVIYNATTADSLVACYK